MNISKKKIFIHLIDALASGVVLGWTAAQIWNENKQIERDGELYTKIDQLEQELRKSDRIGNHWDRFYARNEEAMDKLVIADDEMREFMLETNPYGLHRHDYSTENLLQVLAELDEEESERS